MARAPLPEVRDGMLLAGDERIALGGAAWQAWLAGPASGSFRFGGAGGGCSLVASRPVSGTLIAGELAAPRIVSVGTSTGPWPAAGAGRR